MKIEQIQQVLEIFKTGSFSQAARNLYLSQPNLSHSIKQLEIELGHILFERTTMGIIPTEFGKEFLSYAATLQRQYDDFLFYCTSFRPKKTLSLRIASLNLNFADAAFLELVKNYMSNSVQLSYFHFLSLEQIIEQLTTFQVDLAIIGILSPFSKSNLSKLENHGLEYHSIANTQISAVVGKKHPLFSAKSNTVTLTELSASTLLSYGNSAEDPTFSLPMALGIYNQLTSHIRVDSRQLFYDILMQFPAIGLLAYNTKNRNEGCLLDDNLRFLFIEDSPISCEIGWVKLKRYLLPKPALSFIDDIKKIYLSDL